MDANTSALGGNATGSSRTHIITKSSTVVNDALLAKPIVRAHQCIHVYLYLSSIFTHAGQPVVLGIRAFLNLTADEFCNLQVDGLLSFEFHSARGIRGFCD